MENSEKEKIRESLDEIWDSLGPGSYEYFNNNFASIAPKLLEFLISRLLLEDELEIGFFKEGSKKGAIVSYNIYDKEKQLTLKMDLKHHFELHLEIWDFDDEELIYKYKVVKEYLNIIPDGLKNLTKDVVLSSNPITVKSKTLST